MGLFLTYCPHSEKNVKFDGAMQFLGGQKDKKMGINEKKRVVNGNLIQTFN